MKLNLDCISCNINQVIKITRLLEVKRDKQEEILKETLHYLQKIDYSKSNPEVMKGTWDIITKHIGNNNPYKEIKRFYNMSVSKMTEEILNIIKRSEDELDTSLRVAITGNLIDFAGRHQFDEEILKDKIYKLKDSNLVIDDSKKLFNKLKTSKTLLYLGDNCGEIVLDKIFIKYIKENFPKLKVYFTVRGQAIINDVTIEDAKMVKMNEVAEVIENGDGSLGTVIEKVSDEFKNLFYEADIVIAKGQGNYESLNEINRENIFFLFMVKCRAVAESLQVETMEIICVENQYT